MEDDLIYHEISGINDNAIRNSGRVMVLDKIVSDLTALRYFSGFVGYVKIGWGIPFLLKMDMIKERIMKIHSCGIEASNGGTFLESFAIKGKLESGLNAVKYMGYDIMELSEGIIDLSKRDKNIAREFSESMNMKLVMEVGKKNRNNRMSLSEIIERIEEDLEYNPWMVIVEGRESGKDVGIYDGEGDIKWDWVDEILDHIPLNKVMFEAPMERQQTELIIRLGNAVNLGNISLSSIPSLATQRFGIRGDTLGVEQHNNDFRGSPATMFVYYVIRNSLKIDQSGIVKVTGLNRRTVQNSLSELLNDGYIEERPDTGDMRRKVYRLKAKK